MIEPPTIIIPDVDEERTLVDPRFAIRNQRPHTSTVDRSVSRSTKPGGQVLSSLVSNHGGRIAEIGLALSLLAGLGSVGFQQWKVVTVLRETLAEMKLTKEATVMPSSLHATRSQKELVRESGRQVPLVASVGPEEREAREQRAATLIAENDYPSALSQYETLTELFPSVDAFRHLVYVLRAKLGCDRAGQSGGEPCP